MLALFTVGMGAATMVIVNVPDQTKDAVIFKEDPPGRPAFKVRLIVDNPDGTVQSRSRCS